MQNLAQLDEGFWSYDRAALEKGREAFLQLQKVPAVYELNGLKFHCPSGVYHPTEVSATRLMWRGIVTELAACGPQVLEVGTGCGAIGICLAATGREVTMLDIDPLSVECASSNAALNRIDAKVYLSDMFEAVKGRKYDFIIFNIPLLDKEIEDPIESITCDEGGALFMRFMREAREYLTPEGVVCLSASNIGNRAAILKGLSGYQHSIVRAEYFSAENTWRWIIFARPIAAN